ncbi:biogenesis of lysosome-related organelles complex 1 subunit 5-like [Diretmus argenteus]
MDRIAKDVGEIQSRLIVHRPVTQGEIRYFVREFEEKRGYRENRLLEKLNKMVVESNEQVLPKCSEYMQEHLCDVITRYELELSMEHCKEEWEEFLKEQQRLREEVDEKHAKAVGRLSTQYSEMKKDLSKLSPF